MSDEQKLSAEPTIRLGVSTCLLGERVRYDGGHKRDLLASTPTSSNT